MLTYFDNLLYWQGSLVGANIDLFGMAHVFIEKGAFCRWQVQCSIQCADSPLLVVEPAPMAEGSNA